MFKTDTLNPISPKPQSHPPNPRVGSPSGSGLSQVKSPRRCWTTRGSCACSKGAVREGLSLGRTECFEWSDPEDAIAKKKDMKEDEAGREACILTRSRRSVVKAAVLT